MKVESSWGHFPVRALTTLPMLSESLVRSSGVGVPVAPVVNLSRFQRPVSHMWHLVGSCRHSWPSPCVTMAISEIGAICRLVGGKRRTRVIACACPKWPFLWRFQQGLSFGTILSTYPFLPVPRHHYVLLCQERT